MAWFVSPFLERRPGEHQPDFVLLTVVGLLLFFGLIFLSSASSTLAFFKYDDTYRFVKQQIVHGLLPGLLLFYLAVRINYQRYKNIAWLGLIFSLLLLGLVFVTGAQGGYTARSWVSIGSLSFQPAEPVKLMMIVFLAAWFEKMAGGVKTWSMTLAFVAILFLLSILIVFQPDIGTLSIITLIALAMFYAAGARLTHLLYIIGAGVAAFLAMIKAAPYRVDRITAWLHPETDPQGIGWQIKQSLIAVGSGGWLGLGLGASRQKSYLPQPANDSIFAVIAEEIGFVFTLGLIILFTVLIYRGFQIARNAPDNFGRLIAIGISVWLAVQLFINVAGILKLMPLTGVPLPFVSLGGTNLVVTLIAMGILLNISKYTTR